LIRVNSQQRLDKFPLFEAFDVSVKPKELTISEVPLQILCDGSWRKQVTWKLRESLFVYKRNTRLQFEVMTEVITKIAVFLDVKRLVDRYLMSSGM
jgi:hypothetical protein